MLFPGWGVVMGVIRGARHIFRLYWVIWYQQHGVTPAFYEQKLVKQEKQQNGFMPYLLGRLAEDFIHQFLS